MRQLFIILALLCAPTSLATASEPKTSALEIYDWALETQALVETALIYPEAAYNKALTGKVTVRLEVNKKGEVLKATIVKSSGNKIFDNAARDLVKNIKIPALPDSHGEETLIFDLNLEYDLSGETV